MNGPQTISILHARAPHLPVVLMSGEIDGTAKGRNVSTLANLFSCMNCWMRLRVD